jgi:hypothetical protein
VTLLPAGVITARVVERLTHHGFELRVTDVDEFVARTRVIPAVHSRTSMPVDVVLGGPGLEQLFLDSAERLQLGGSTIPVATAEHLVVMKLLAGRPKDIDDATAIVRGSCVVLAEVESLIDAIAEGLGEDDIRATLAKLRERLDS